MRNFDNPEYTEALQEVLEALLQDNPTGIEIRISLNECEGYSVLQRIFDYMQGVIVSSTGYYTVSLAKESRLSSLLF